MPEAEDAFKYIPLLAPEEPQRAHIGRLSAVLIHSLALAAHRAVWLLSKAVGPPLFSRTHRVIELAGALLLRRFPPAFRQKRSAGLGGSRRTCPSTRSREWVRARMRVKKVFAGSAVEGAAGRGIQGSKLQSLWIAFAYTDSL